jgi:hypothetical protein
MKKLIVFFLVFCFIPPVFGHQPRIVLNTGTLENPIKIKKPEISKAYYAELRGAPEYYEINSETDFLLYLNILAPDLESARTDFFAEILFEGVVFFTLDSDKWEKFYEPFGGDNYLLGPEFEKTVRKGTYVIKVSNLDNTGKYALAVGKVESFPPMEILKTFIVLPKIKQDFFGKSPLTAYFNLSGLFLLVVIFILAAISYIMVRLIRKS